MNPSSTQRLLRAIGWNGTSSPNAAFIVTAAAVASSTVLWFGTGEDDDDLTASQRRRQQQQAVIPRSGGGGTGGGLSLRHTWTSPAQSEGAGGSTPRLLGTSGKKREKFVVPISCADGTQVIPYQPPSRDEQLSRLHEEEFDMLIIGGGSAGCGIALDASLRGLRVALVERDDFAAGTSGRSTKLIHGGIRYLENAFKKLDYGEYELVKEALEERKHMLDAAPYMNKPLPIMIPMYNHNWYDVFKVPYYLAGAFAYDLVAGRHPGVPGSHFIGKDEAMFQFPMLREEKLLGAIVYYDGQMNDTRMCLHLALTAAQNGAAVSSRVEVLKLMHDPDTGRLTGAVVRDNYNPKKKEFVVKARTVVNATGPFADSIRQMDDPDTKPIIKGAGGVHVLLPDHYSPSKMGLIVPKTKDGRVLFFLPWEGGTIAGTTDHESELTMVPRPKDRDIGFILAESNNYLRKDKSVSTEEVRAAWSGIRPLVTDPSKSDTQSISRSHVIEVSEKGKLVTIAGGKWTTYRRMAQDTVDRVLDEMPECADGRALHRECETMGRGIIGADRAGIVTGGKFDRIVVTLREDYGLPKDVAYHLVHNYGTRALQIAEITRKGSEIYDRRFVSSNGDVRRICSKYPYLEAEVKFAVEQEYALTAVDVLARRTRLAFIDSEAARNATKRVVSIMGDLLGWNHRKRRQEEEDCLEWLESMNMEEKATTKS